MIVLIYNYVIVYSDIQTEIFRESHRFSVVLLAHWDTIEANVYSSWETVLRSAEEIFTIWPCRMIRMFWQEYVIGRSLRGPEVHGLEMKYYWNGQNAKMRYCIVLWVAGDSWQRLATPCYLIVGHIFHTFCKESLGPLRYHTITVTFDICFGRFIFGVVRWRHLHLPEEQPECPGFCQGSLMMVVCYCLEGISWKYSI